MLLTYRHVRPSLPLLSTLRAGTQHLDRATSPLLAFTLILCVALAGLTATRITRIERDVRPALENTRQLAEALEATRLLLRDARLGSVDARIARADSQAHAFHHLAAAARLGADASAPMLAYDATFAGYYVAARRSAAGLSMSADADGSSAEDASLGYAMLRQNLADGADAQERALDAKRPATAPVELAAYIAFSLLAAAALMRRVARRTIVPAPAPMEARSVATTATPVAGDSSVIRLHEAVERLARRRLAASIAAAKVAKRNNERQIELARSWNVPILTVVPATQPHAEMGVYEEESTEPVVHYGGLTLVSA